LNFYLSSSANSFGAPCCKETSKSSRYPNSFARETMFNSSKFHAALGRTKAVGRRSCVACSASCIEPSRRSLLLGAAATGVSKIWLPGATYAAPEPTSAYEFSALQYERERSLDVYRGKYFPRIFQFMPSEVS
ncbi:hypothetical protein VaNZ11_016240, partial [Volvox africanus]